jgi:hypothetical protein
MFPTASYRRKETVTSPASVRQMGACNDLTAVAVVDSGLEVVISRRTMSLDQRPTPTAKV